MPPPEAPSPGARRNAIGAALRTAADSGEGGAFRTGDPSPAQRATEAPHVRGLRWVVEVVALRPRRSAPAGRAEALTEVERINRFSPSLIPALGGLGADRFARLPAAVAAEGHP